jgi:hypothetical protein
LVVVSCRAVNDLNLHWFSNLLRCTVQFYQNC